MTTALRAEFLKLATSRLVAGMTGLAVALTALIGVLEAVTAGTGKGMMLIVLDNAGSVEQVRPLLPGSPGCAVVVTSRDSLAGLVARHGAARLELDLLQPAEAVILLRALIGRRVEDDPGAAGTLVSQCCRLPLALRVAAELAIARPDARLADLAGELADQRRRLDRLDAGGDHRTGVRAVFSWSVQQLSPSAARLFRLLGVHRGPDISIPAAASLAGVEPAQAGGDLAELAGAHLVTEPAPGRYSVHDLLHAYAAEQARTREHERRAAIGRLLDHYLHSARAAAAAISPDTAAMLTPAAPEVVPAAFLSARQACAWYEAEHQVLVAAVTLAAETGFDAYAWQLSAALYVFLDWGGHLHEWVAAQRAALDAATRLEDKAGQARSSFLLGLSRVRLVCRGPGPRRE